MPHYILLLKGVNEKLSEKSPEELQKLFEQYDEWVERINDDNKLRAAQKLKDDIRYSVTIKQGKVVDGPFAETKETIGGFFVVETETVQEAIELAKRCPVVTHGGSVELREVCRYSSLLA